MDEEEFLLLLQTHLALNWLYEEKCQPETGLKELIIPPRDHLEVIYEFSVLGDMRGVMDQSKHILEWDKQYHYFCQKVNDLAQTFDDEKLTQWMEKLLE